MVDLILDRLTTGYPAAADPGRATAMTAYMRGQFRFLGIMTEPRRRLDRQLLAGLPAPQEHDLAATALACWDLTEREYQYFAVGWLARHATLLTPGFLQTARRLVTTKSWWDTVDALASNVVGSIVARHPASAAVMDEWAADDNLWVARTAILHQLRRKASTDTDRLFGYCADQAGHQDFFIRKAIGWALRQHAKTDPAAVRAFVATTTLSPLSTREALKNL
jgi:3-methyladenine DNA glycosylase AlkD